MLSNFSRQRLRISYSLLIICVTKAAIWSAISTLPNSAVAAPLSEFMDRDQRSLHTAAPSSLTSPSALSSSEFDSFPTQPRDSSVNVAQAVIDASQPQQSTSFVSNAHGTVHAHSASSQHASTPAPVAESADSEAAAAADAFPGVLRANENYFRTMKTIEHEIDMLEGLSKAETAYMKEHLRRALPMEITVGGGMSVGARSSHSRLVGDSPTKIRAPGYCATFGTCDKPSNPMGPVNCPNNTLAVKPDFDITEFCPQFKDKACCSETQYKTLSDNLNQAIVILQRCPACINNFIRFWCAYTCSPDQSVFVEVVETKIGSLGLPVSNHTAFSVGYDFGWGFFNSCLNVRFGATGLTVLGALFGNPQTPVQLFSFMGTPPTSPFLISMTVTDQGVTNNTLINYPAIPCNSSDYSEECSCVDCPAVCSGGGGSTAPNPNEYRNETVDVLKVGDNYFDTVNLGLLLGYVLYLSALVLAMAYFMNHKGRWGLFAIGFIAALLVVTAVLYGAAAPEVQEYTFPLHRTTLTGGYDYKTVLNTGHVEVFNSFWTSGAFSGYVILVVALVIAAVCGAVLFHRLQHSLSVSHSGLFREEKKGDAHPSRILMLIFGNIAKVCARKPWLVIACCLLATGLCSIGILKLQIETDPVKLWVPPDSDVIAEKNFFDSHFAPFYRVNQFIVTMSDPLPGESILNPKYLKKVLALQERVEGITAYYQGQPVVWGDLCFRPIPGKGCMLESITEYFSLYNTTNGYIPDDPAEALSWIMHCSQQFMYDSKCRGVVGAPNFPYVVMGGYPKGTTLYNETTALVVTFLLNNYANITDMAEEWENKFLEIMAAGEPGLHLAYNAERSVSDELARGSTSDISIVVISYVVMFVYISFALGRVFPFDYKLIFVRTKFVLGFSAILLVFCSLAISVGICSAAGVAVTPIISEVIPFLVLAIGIDNVFIILGTFQNQDPRKSIEERLTVTLVHVGTSISLASLSESFAFMLGALTKMPAVRSFAFYSAVAIFADYLLQITAFCAVLVLDARRRDQNRIDCLPCVQIDGVKERDYTVDYITIPGNNSAPVRVMGSEDQASLLQGEFGVVDSNYQPSVDNHAGVSPAGGPGQMVPKDGILKTFMRNYFVPVILHRITKIVVLVVFVGYFLFSIGYMYHNLQLGLDQAQAVPTDSYLQEYFKDIATILRVGPPVYFVVKGGTPTTNFSLIPNQNRICGINHCPANSLETLAAQASTHSLLSYMAPGATVMNWFDDYNSWLLATGSPCCRTFANGTYCPTEYNAGVGECPPCITDNSQIVNNSRVITPLFRQWLQTFLTESSCTTQCGSCGWGHNADVELTPDGLDIANSRYPTFHTPLQTQADFINAVKQARQLAQNISAEQNLEVFPYSVFYVYFDQYLYIQGVAILNTGLAGAGIFVLCLVVTWSFWASLIIMITIGMILGCLLGVMALWGISLNAVSTVNFVMAIGISVEFCIHIAVAFLRSYGSRDHRVGAALVNVGSSVVSGITLTKLCGVITLGFASSEIFIIYYFRMYFAIVILGFFHGLVFLPVVLSLVGPEQYDNGEKTEEDSDNDSNRDENEPRREVDNDAYSNIDERVSGGVNDYGSTAGHNYSTF